MPGAPAIDQIDRRIIEALQGGLPLVSAPYQAVGDRIGISGAAVQDRLARMLESGIVRRIGAIPNHYALGVTANGMSVWDVADDAVATLGARVGALDFVTHCYTRPRHLPRWPYNLFAMVHGRDRGEVMDKVAEIARLLGPAARAHDVLFSTRILKKSGLRIAAREDPRGDQGSCSD
ncbi:MAG: AsnC family transcriptional regulator [Alphaproteobacteria bacterium]